MQEQQREQRQRAEQQARNSTQNLNDVVLDRTQGIPTMRQVEEIASNINQMQAPQRPVTIPRISQVPELNANPPAAPQQRLPSVNSVMNNREQGQLPPMQMPDSIASSMA